MRRSYRIAYFAHAIRSDWNNGNAHFLRGLLRALVRAGHEVTAFEPENDWSITNLRAEPCGSEALAQFAFRYPELRVIGYLTSQSQDREFWSAQLRAVDVVILHEWNPCALAALFLELRCRIGFSLLFHDTHHRASTSPEQIAAFRVSEFDGVIAFGDALRRVYLERLHVTRAWTLHEAADVSVFYPQPAYTKEYDCVWIGNWGDAERSDEIDRFFLRPAAYLPQYRFHIFGVRYPHEGLEALSRAGVEYRGYLPNLSAPNIYSRSKLTVHIPRQQYSQVMDGIPTIRVFEALACGIPLISAPWRDSEKLFRKGDFTSVSTCAEMKAAIEQLLSDPSRSTSQAQRGRETVLQKHTCDHRAAELASIIQEIRR